MSDDKLPDVEQVRKLLVGADGPQAVLAALTAAGIPIERVVRPVQAGARPMRPHSNLPVGAQWIHHEKPGSRAARRRLRQAAKGHHRLEDRCSICHEWTSAALGGYRDPKSGKFACNGCAAAYVQGLTK